MTNENEQTDFSGVINAAIPLMKAKNDMEATIGVVTAYVSNNPMPADAVPAFIRNVYAAVQGVSAGDVETARKANHKPAVDPKKSVHEDFIICLEDGKKFKSLKRHLMSHYGLTPEAYREKWGFPPTYPMVAPSYAARRSELAKQTGLGKRAK